MGADEPLLERVRRERAEAERQEAVKREEDQKELGLEGYTLEWGKDAPVGCTPVRITGPSGQVSTGMACFGRGARRRRCEFCNQDWSVAQCDYPTGGPCPKCKGKKTRGSRPCHDCAGTGYRMCNRRLCKACRAHREPDEDYCPDHRVYAGFPPLVKRERSFWTTTAREIINRKCLHKECETIISYSDRVLFFPNRKRAMCERCGTNYLELAV